MKDENCITLDKKILREGWTLQERINHVRKERSNRCKPKEERNTNADLKEWEKSFGDSSGANFKKRLKWAGLTFDDAAWITNPPDKDVPKHPEWWNMLQLLRFEGGKFSDSGILDDRCKNRPFVHAWRSVAAWALEELRNEFIDHHYYSKINESAWVDLGQGLLDKLCTSSDQALWELFNERRTSEQIIIAYFNKRCSKRNGASHVIYDEFIAELKNSNYSTLLERYPVMGRLLAIIVQQWLKNSKELLHRISECRMLLSKKFGFPPNAPLEAIQTGLSDPHREGMTVAILRFGRSLDGEKIVYKPKSLDIDQAWHEVLEVLNQESDLPRLRVVKILNFHCYGFMDYVEHRLCKGKDELSSFYKNTGRLIAILHMMGCTDCHYENLIANGDQLILIDSETMFEVDLCTIKENRNDKERSIRSIIDKSVLRCELLPQWIIINGPSNRRYDISALGIEPPPKELLLPCWVGLNSDGMMPGSSVKEIELPTCLPYVQNDDQHHTDFIEEICSGFVEQISEVLRIRTRLIKKIQSFRNCDRRIVLKGTRTYCVIIQEMLKPKALRSATQQGYITEQIIKNWVLPDKPPTLWKIHEAELLQMQQLNIPYFNHRIDEKTISPMEGIEPIDNWTKNTGIDCAVERLNLLDRNEITFQEKIIRGSLEARKIDHLKGKIINFSVSIKQKTAKKKVNFIKKKQLESVGLQICEELWDEAIISKKSRPEWLGIEPSGNFTSYRFGLLGSSIYSGKIGIALAMARSALVYSDPSLELSKAWQERASACIEHLDETDLEYSNTVIPRAINKKPLGIMGLGGTLLGLYLLEEAKIYKADYLVDKLLANLRQDIIMEDICLDILGGVAGLIGPLLLIGTSRSMELAFTCGERLLALQQENGSWARNGDQTAAEITALLGPYPQTIGSKRRSLETCATSFCYGSSGIAAALGRLAQSTNHEQFKNAARKALVYEREEQNKMKNVTSNALTKSSRRWKPEPWGEGSSGMILSRVIMQHANLKDEATISEIDIARREIKKIFKEYEVNSQFDNSFASGPLGLECLLSIESGINQGESGETQKQKDCNKIKKINFANYQNLNKEKQAFPDQLGLFTGKSGVALWMFEQHSNLNWLKHILTAGLL